MCHGRIQSRYIVAIVRWIQKQRLVQIQWNLSETAPHGGNTVLRPDTHESKYETAVDRTKSKYDWNMSEFFVQEIHAIRHSNIYLFVNSQRKVLHGNVEHLKLPRVAPWLSHSIHYSRINHVSRRY